MYTSRSPYQKLPPSATTYVAHVVAVENPLNLHLQIYWPDSMHIRYKDALHYDYSYIAEEHFQEVQNAVVYSCHFKGVEVCSADENNLSQAMKEAYIFMTKKVHQSNGWFLVSVNDIDVYRRILINLFDIITRKSINIELLEYRSEITQQAIARTYIRPSKKLFQPNKTSPTYHLVFDKTDASNDEN